MNVKCVAQITEQDTSNEWPSKLVNTLLLTEVPLNVSSLKLCFLWYVSWAESLLCWPCVPGTLQHQPLWDRPVFNRVCQMDVPRELCRFGHQEVSGKAATYWLGDGDGPCFHFMIWWLCAIGTSVFSHSSNFFSPQRENLECK